MNWLTIAALVVLVVLAVRFGQPSHPEFWWDSIPGFWAAFGLAGGLFLTWLAKGILARWLERPEEFLR